METISWQDFEMVELRVGTLVRVEPFPEARKPAYKVWADLALNWGFARAVPRSLLSTSQSSWWAARSSP